MSTKYCAFDLEIAKPVRGSDWQDQRPLGISCAATYTSDGDLVLWNAAQAENDVYPERMNPQEVQELAGYLLDQQAQGYTVTTWNGLSFDFDVLAEECNNAHWARDIEQLALDHIDPAFQMHTEMGYMIGLETCGLGLVVGTKTEGMHGDLAPILWSGYPDWADDELRARVKSLDAEPGTPAAQALCLEYVGQDAKLTAAIYEGLIKQRQVYWTTRRGTRSRYPWTPIQSDGRLLTVREAYQTPEPDTSWMTDPRPRSDFIKWMSKEVSSNGK